MTQHEAIPVEPDGLTRNFYTYRGVRYYTQHRPVYIPSWASLLDRPARKVDQWAYLCLWPSNTAFTIDTSMNDIQAALSCTRCEHIRKEITVSDDEPQEPWQQPKFFVLAGWDYQHYGMDYDRTEEELQADAHEAIDALIAHGVVRNLSEIVELSNKVQP